MVCSACQRENPPGSKFCGQCGAPLELRCTVCQTANLPGNRFCNECGAPLAGSSPPAAHAASPRAYTPRHLAERILTSRGALEGERKQVTVMFADIAGFTALAERLDPEDLHLLMDQVFAILLDIIHRYEGTVNQFLGDGVMALFGAPVALEDHALRAVEAALEVQATMRARAEEFHRRFGTVPVLRIGINTGRVVVGRIGDDLRMDYTAQGDTVNLAARLEALAPPGSIFIGPTTRRLVDWHIACESVGVRSVKGKPELVEVFRPLGPVELSVRDADAAVDARRGMPGPGVFVGRDEELGLLLEVFDEVTAGQPRTVAVVGEAGMGKSRLVAEFRRRLDHPRLRWLAGQCVPYGRATPYRPLIGLLRGLCGLRDGEAEPTALEKLETLLDASPELATVAGPVLRVLLGLSEAEPALSVLSGADRKAVMARVLDHLLARAHPDEPRVLLVENAQWLDPASAEYLTGLSRRAAGPVMLVLTLRPDEAAHAAAGPEAERIVLRPLTVSQCQTLVRRLAADRLPAPLITAAIDRAGGNPFFLEELVGTLLVAGPGVLPPTVEALLAARVDRLPQRLKTVLQTAAVIGEEFTAAILERVLGGPVELSTTLRELAALGFITEVESGTSRYRFRQPLLQEVAYEGLLSQRRRSLHQAIGEAILALYPHRQFEHLEQLARHFTRAEDWPRAARYHWEAGRKAAALCANQEAVTRLERALAILARLPESLERTADAIDLRLDLCPPLLQLGRLGDVLRLAEEAQQLAQALGDPLRIAHTHEQLSNIHYLLGDPGLAIQHARRGLELAEREPTAHAAHAVRQYLGTSCHALGDYPAAREVLARQLEALAHDDAHRRLGPVQLSYVASAGWLAFTLAELGEFAEAERTADRGRRLAEVSRHPYLSAIGATFAGLVRSWQGDLEGALPPLRAALETCQEHGLVVWHPVAAALLGHALALHGAAEEGVALLRDALAQTEALGVRAYRALWVACLAEAQLVRGEIVRASETAEQAVALAARHQEHGNHARALRVLAAAQLQLGPGWHGSSFDHLRHAIAEAESRRMRPLLARCYDTMAELAAAQGDSERAAQHRATAEGICRELGMRLPARAVHDTRTGVTPAS